MATNVEFQVALTIAVVGACGVSKSAVITQLLHEDALATVFDSKSTGADDVDISPLLKQLIPSAAALSQAQQARRIIPSIGSLGISYKSSEFAVDSTSLLTSKKGDSSSSVSVSFIVECLEVGGATCVGPYQDKEQIVNAVRCADVVLALYDLCDRDSLKQLSDNIMPIVIEASKSGAFQPTPTPICICGTKVDIRKAISNAPAGSTEFKSLTVVGASDQRAFEAVLPPNAIFLNSVSARSGHGMLRLRRELLYDALRSRSPQLKQIPIFDPSTASAATNDNDDGTTVWLALATETTFLDQNVTKRGVKNLDLCETVLQQQARLEEERRRREQQQQQASNSGGGVGSAADGDGDGGGTGSPSSPPPPVVDVSSTRSGGDDNGKKNKKGNKKGEGEGVSCSLCGCAAQ